MPSNDAKKGEDLGSRDVRLGLSVMLVIIVIVIAIVS
jgi:hypothetical protein